MLRPQLHDGRSPIGDRHSRSPRNAVQRRHRYAPFVVDAAFPCGEEGPGGGEELRFRLDIGLGDASVGVLDGNRGVLSIDAQHVYAIDVGEATSNHCCHYTRYHGVLIRRVATS